MEQSPPLGQRPRLLLQGGAIPFRLSPFEGVTLLAVLAVTAFLGYTIYARMTDLNLTPPAAATYLPAFRTTLTSSVSATGTVQSSQQVTLTFGSSGKIKEFLVGLGAQVKAGQPLARIDDTQLQQGLQSAQASLASAQARLDATLDGASATDLAAAQQSLAAARAQVSTAQKNLDDVLARPTVTELTTAQQGVLSAQNSLQSANDALTKAQNDAAQAQTDVQTAQSDVQTKFDTLSFAYSELQLADSLCGGTPATSVPSRPVQGLTATPVATPSAFLVCSGNSAPNLATYKAAAANYNAAVNAYNASLTTLTTKQNALTTVQNNLNSGNPQRSIQNAQLGLLNAQQKYQDTIAGPKQSDIESARRSLESAQASLASAQAKHDALFQPPAPDVVLPLQASVEQARASVETAKKNLADATIVAPFDGQISQMTGEVGSQVSANTTVFILLNPRLIRIDANVDQADVSNLKAGQTANATFDALPGRTFPATVTAIGLTPAIQQGVVTYVVSLGIDTSRLAADAVLPAPGMTASISATTNRVENALVVPARAIRRSGRTSTVTVKGAAGDEQRPVTTGATNGTLTQIVSGIDEGQEVLVSAPRATTTTTGQQGQQFFPGGGGTVPVR